MSSIDALYATCYPFSFVEAIALNVFFDSWLDGMQKQQVFAGVNWDKDLCGLEIEAMVLKNALVEKFQDEAKVNVEADA